MKRIIRWLSFILCILFFIFSVFFYLKVQENNRYIDKLINSTISGRNLKTCQEIVIAISDAVYRRTNRSLDRNILGLYERFESVSFFNMTSAVSLKYDGFGIIGHSTIGPCGTMSRVLLNALWRLGIPARKLQLLSNTQGKVDSHTMVEFYDNGRWLVISPADNSFVWKKKNGEIATVEEIRNDETIFRQIYDLNPGYIYLFTNSKNIRWEKLPRNIVKIIRFFMGEQAFNNTSTPKLYDMPRTLFLILSIASSLFFEIALIIFKCKEKK